MRPLGIPDAAGTFCHISEIVDKIADRDYPSGDDQRAAYESFTLADVMADLL